MRRLSWVYRVSARPQLVVVCLVSLLALGGIMAPKKVVNFPTITVASELSSQIAGASSLAPINCSAASCLALTFDDGPDTQITPQVLDILDRYNVKATFFVQGNRIARNQDLLRREYSSGHEIGNHSWSHPRFTEISPEQAENEITSTQAAIMAAGVPAPHLFRPPYGDINPAVAARIPLTIIRWNIDPEDWHPKRRTHLLNHMATHAKPGGIVILHDTEETTAQVLEALILQLQASNYSLVTVSEILELPPGQSGVFFGR